MAVTTSAASADIATPATRSHERVFMILVWALALIFSSLPVLAGYLFATSEYQFVGIVYNMPDHAQYFAWMRDLAHEPLAPNRLTPEPNAPAFFNLLWWAVGRIGSLTGLEYAALWSGLRLVAAATVLAAGYAFLNLAVADVQQRRLAYLIFIFGGGLGFIWVIVKYVYRLPEAPFPFNIYTAEANTFWIITAFPHFGMALALIVAMMALLLQAMRAGRYRYAVVCGVLGAILGLQHAYDLITVYAVIGSFGLLIWLRDRRFPAFLFRCGLIVFALSAPAAAYLSALVLLDPRGAKIEPVRQCRRLDAAAVGVADLAGCSFPACTAPLPPSCFAKPERWRNARRRLVRAPLCTGVSAGQVSDPPAARLADADCHSVGCGAGNSRYSLVAAAPLCVATAGARPPLCPNGRNKCVSRCLAVC